MPHYLYTDHLAGPVTHSVAKLALGRPGYGKMVPVHAGAVLFECQAKDILEADALLFAATGRIAEKDQGIGCAIS